METGCLPWVLRALPGLDPGDDTAPLDGKELQADPAAGTAAKNTFKDFVPTVLAALAVMILIHTLLRAQRRNAARKSNLSRPAPERIADARVEAQMRRDPVERLMADATELCQRLATQLDSKAAALEVLIDRAEQAATRLERARGGPSPAPAEHSLQEPLQRRVYELADQGLSARDIAAKVGQPQGHVELMLNLRRA